MHIIYLLSFTHFVTILSLKENIHLHNAQTLPLKRQGGQFDHPPSPLPPFLCGSSKNVSSKERVKPWFFVIFNIILRHIFPENFIEFPQVVQKI